MFMYLCQMRSLDTDEYWNVSARDVVFMPPTVSTVGNIVYLVYLPMGSEKYIVYASEISYGYFLTRHFLHCCGSNI